MDILLTQWGGYLVFITNTFTLKKIVNSTLKNMVKKKIVEYIRITLEFFEKCKCPDIVIFIQSSRCVSYEHPFLKTTEPYEDILLLSGLFHFFYFIFSAPISFCLCSPISLSLFCCCCSFSSLYQVQ